MASLAPKECCVSGVKHEGTPKGSVVAAGSVSAYVSGDRGAKKAVLLLTDVFGFEFNNNRLLADSFAEKGYFAVVPDLFGGEALTDLAHFADWLPRHSVAQTEPRVLEALRWLEEDVGAAVYVVGYCFGAKYAIRLLGDGTRVRAAAVAHPSLVDIDEVARISKPLLISGAQTDPVYTPELRAQTEAKLKEIKATYFVSETSGVSHGFAVRGDPSDPWQRIAQDKAFGDAVWWFSLF